MSPPDCTGLAWPGLAWLLAGASASLANPLDESEPVYRVTRTQDLAEVEITAVEGTGLTDGTLQSLDIRSLSDSAGAPYVMIGDLGIEDEAETFLETHVGLYRRTSTYFSEGEIESIWLESNPEATDDDLEAFRARRAVNDVVPRLPLHVDPAVEEFLASAGPEDTVEARVVLRDDPPFDLPRVGAALFEQDPAFVLEQMRQRVIAIEQRKTQLERMHEPLIEVAESYGGTVLARHWLVNRFVADLTPAAIAALSARDDVARIEWAVPYALDQSNAGEEIRHATQVNQLIGDGFTGDRPSGQTGSDDILIGVIDMYFDEDHPAWADRLAGWRVWDPALNGGAGAFRNPNPGEQSCDGGGGQEHGNGVLTQLLADLTAGQDPAITGASDRAAKSGQTWNSEFFVVDRHGAGGTREEAIGDLMQSEVVDILNMSQSHDCDGCNYCDNSSSENDAVNNLMLLDDVFVVNTPGNTGQGSCRVQPPGTAAASFTAGAYQRNAVDLNSASIRSTSPRGGDNHGRALIDLVAPSGRTGTHYSRYDDSYDTGGQGTSFAAPVIAGAAANFKDMFIAMWGQSAANDVGNIYAHMLLMGDEQLQNGTKAGTGAAEHDSIWGAGRLRMRMYNSAGMDAPYRVR